MNLISIQEVSHTMKKKYIAMAFLLSLGLTMTAAANDIRHVFVVDDMTLEVEMKEPLTEEELHPTNLASDGYQSPFAVNEGVQVIGLPVPQKSDGFHDNIYRIPVSGMDPGPIYQISYQGKKPKTFKVYRGREQTDRYRDRYGSYF